MPRILILTVVFHSTIILELGVAGNNKLGFFGMDDSATSHINGSRKWTYVPEATNTSEVISGTKGYLDIKGIYYQSGDFSTHGIVYFDSGGLQTSTTAPSAATFTSTQILTAVTEISNRTTKCSKCRCWSVYETSRWWNTKWYS